MANWNFELQYDINLTKFDPNLKFDPFMYLTLYNKTCSLCLFLIIDYIVVGSDSGRIVILEYIPSKNSLEKVHQETFGKSGCRRIVPGQYFAIDPKGRAVMIGAVEKQKLAYIMNRDTQARLTISSPLEAHKSNTLTYHMVGVDVGFDNPMFACLEIDYEEADLDPTGKGLSTSKFIPFPWRFNSQGPWLSTTGNWLYLALEKCVHWTIGAAVIA